MLIIFKCERQLYFELQCRRARRDLGYHLNQIPCFTSNGTEAQKSLVTCSRSDLSDLIKGFAENCGSGSCISGSFRLPFLLCSAKSTTNRVFSGVDENGSR